jgi:predicted N-acyltransferase
MATRPWRRCCLQIVTLDHSHLGDVKRRRILRKLGSKMRTRVLVCGNLLVYGLHGVSIAAGADRAKVWQAVSEVIYRVRRAEKLAGSTDIVLLKDFDAAARQDSAILRKLSYGAVETEPNMVLTVNAAWRRHEDYLQSLSSKFRSDIKNRVFKRFDDAGCKLEKLDDVAAHATELQHLYLQVHGNAGLRPFTVPASYWPELAELAGANAGVHVARRDGNLIGFIVSVLDGDTALAYHIGFDRQVAGEGVPVYLRLLHASLARAIELGAKRVSFGRTALEPKARLGCKPEATIVWARHRHPFLNQLLQPMLKLVEHDEAPAVEPFK